MAVRDTGSPRADAENDFIRARRHQVLSALAGWLRNDTHDVVQTLSFDEAVDALGRRGEVYRGTHVIPLDAIIGSVDRMRDFDRRFRPTSSRSRQRWERLARASRTGETIPPIDVYQLGGYYFVRDGHHRVSVARALNLDVIEANVTEVLTMLSPVAFSRRDQLERKHWRRIFLERVPLTREQRGHIEVSDPVHYGWLAEMVEAWGARLMHGEETYLDRVTIARRWYEEDFCPVLEMIEDAEVRGEDETEADAYMRVSGERYRLVREHEWSRDVMAQISRGRRRRRRSDDPTRL